VLTSLQSVACKGAMPCRNLVPAHLDRPAWSRRRLLTGVVFAAATQALAGCSLFGKSPTTAEGTISASQNLNVGALRHSSPVVVRLYDLKEPAGFEAADFLALFQREQETLAADLLGRTEYLVQPGQTVRIEQRTLSPDAHAIGVVAAFQNVERATWRALVPLRLNARNKIEVRLDGMTVTATAQK